jgi:hypothetical protein
MRRLGQINDPAVVKALIPSTCKGSPAASRARAARAPQRTPGAPRPTRRQKAGSRLRWRSTPSHAPCADPSSPCRRRCAAVECVAIALPSVSDCESAFSPIAFAVSVKVSSHTAGWGSAASQMPVPASLSFTSSHEKPHHTLAASTASPPASEAKHDLSDSLTGMRASRDARPARAPGHAGASGIEMGSLLRSVQVTICLSL